MARSRKLHFDEEDMPDVIKEMMEIRLNMMRARETAKTPEERLDITEYAFEALIIALANHVGVVEGTIETIFLATSEYAEEIVEAHEQWYHELEGEGEEEEEPALQAGVAS